MHRRTRVDNILNDNQMLALDIIVEVFEDFHRAARRRAVAITGGNHKVEVDGQLDLPHEVRIEHHRALQDADAENILVKIFIIGRNLGTELGNTLLQLFLRIKYFLDVLIHILTYHRSCLSFL